MWPGFYRHHLIAFVGVFVSHSPSASFAFYRFAEVLDRSSVGFFEKWPEQLKGLALWLHRVLWMYHFPFAFNPLYKAGGHYTSKLLPIEC